MPVLCLPGNHDELRAMRRELDMRPFVVGGSLRPRTVAHRAARQLHPGLGERPPEPRQTSTQLEHALTAANASLHGLPAPSSGADGAAAGSIGSAWRTRRNFCKPSIGTVMCARSSGGMCTRLRRAAQGRADAGDAFHLRAVPAARGRVRGGPAPAGISYVGAAPGRLAAYGGRVGRKTCWSAPRARSPRLPDAPHAASPVWAIHGDHNTVYLAGSVHLLKASDSALPAGFDRAYRGSRELVMELGLGKVDPMEAAGWMMEHGMLPEGTTLRDDHRR